MKLANSSPKNFILLPLILKSDSYLESKSTKAYKSYRQYRCLGEKKSCASICAFIAHSTYEI